MRSAAMPSPPPSQESAGRIKLFALMISGFTAGIGGLIHRLTIGCRQRIVRRGDLLAAVAARRDRRHVAVRGVGSVIGTAIGVIMISDQQRAVLLNIADFWQQIIIGCIIIGQ